MHIHRRSAKRRPHKKKKQKILRFNSNYRNPDEDKPGIAVKKKNVKNKSNRIEHTFLTTYKPNKYTSESLQSLEKSTFVCPEEGSGNGRYVDA